jgi:hypothetical protein
MTKPSPGIQEKAPHKEVKGKLGSDDKKLDEALDESMDASDPLSITQPGKNIIGPND